MSEDATLDEFIDGSGPDASEDNLMTSLDETSVGNIPSDWSVVRLSEITEDTLYGANESAEEYDPNKPRYIRIKDIDERGRLKQSDKASLSANKAEGYLLHKGDMLFARSGSPGRTYLHRHESGKYCYGGYSIKHELVTKGLNHEYLSQYTKSQKYWDWIERIARTGAQANINSREYASLLVPYPPLPEQRKIATVLYTIDKYIEKTEKIEKQINRTKKAMSQSLFHTGIDDFETKNAWMGKVPSHWKVQQFSETIEHSQNGIYKKENEYGGKYPIIKMGDIFGGVTLDEPINETVHLTDKELNKYATKEGDLVFARHAQAGWGAGDCTYVPDMNETAVVESNMIHIRLSSEVDPLFYSQYFNSEIGVKSIKRITTTGNIKSVSQGDLMSLKVPIPPKDEQESIAEILTMFDKQAKHSQSELKRLRHLKKGLLQDLLSGTVRTTDTNITVPDEVAQHG